MVKGNDQLCDPYEEEFTKEEDASYMMVSPKEPSLLFKTQKRGNSPTESAMDTRS